MKTASYYIGRRTFKSKSGKDCYMVALIVQGRDSWSVCDRFVDKPTYDDCANLEAGAAVDLIVDFARNSLVGLDLSTEFCPLPLGAELA